MACKNLLQTDIVTCRAAIAARTANMTIECSNTLNYNSGHNNCTLTTAYRLIERQTDRQTNRTLRLIELLLQLKSLVKKVYVSLDCMAI